MEMRTELKRLHQETGSTFVYVTHDQLEAMTLSTKLCLMKNGLLQQYSSPLEVYGKPANLFAADFVGNPSINLIHMDAEEKDGHIALSNADMKVQFIPVEDLKIPGHKKVVLGIRPELLKQTEENCLETSVESSLPSGMFPAIRYGDDSGNQGRPPAYDLRDLRKRGFQGRNEDPYGICRQSLPVIRCGKR